MAELDYGDYGGDAQHAADRSGRMARWVNLAGAVTSVALVAGLALWGYRLAVRDVTGIPVIRAMAGPARVAPDDPGGELDVHQGLAVNAVAADGEAQAPAERLVLAPGPGGLSGDDLAMGKLATRPVPAAPEATDPVLAALNPPADPTLTTPLDLIDPSIPGVSRSLRPMPRPEGDAMAEAAAAAVAVALAPEPDLDVDPATLPVGTRLVQLGTFPTDEAARAGWDQATAAFGPLLDGKRRVIEKAEINGLGFYRLRVEGFSDIADARRFCSVLEGQKATCVPTQVR